MAGSPRAPADRRHIHRDAHGQRTFLPPRCDSPRHSHRDPPRHRLHHRRSKAPRPPARRAVVHGRRAAALAREPRPDRSSTPRDRHRDQRRRARALPARDGRRAREDRHHPPEGPPGRHGPPGVLRHVRRAGGAHSHARQAVARKRRGQGRSSGLVCRLEADIPALPRRRPSVSHDRRRSGGDRGHRARHGLFRWSQLGEVGFQTTLERQRS